VCLPCCSACAIAQVGIPSPTLLPLLPHLFHDNPPQPCPRSRSVRLGSTQSVNKRWIDFLSTVSFAGSNRTFRHAAFFPVPSGRRLRTTPHHTFPLYLIR
jgi:hypothetical protein